MESITIALRRHVKRKGVEESVHLGERLCKNIVLLYYVIYGSVYTSVCVEWYSFNTLRPRQNGRHFADDTFKRIFLNENVWISLRFSLKFVPKVRINNIPSLVQIVAWCRPGDKPLSEPMMVSLLTHICVTRPQWVIVFIFLRVYSSDLGYCQGIIRTTLKNDQHRLAKTMGIFDGFQLMDNSSNGPIDNKSALDQVMAWSQTDDKTLPELILTHIWGTRGWWLYIHVDLNIIKQ